MKRTRVDDAVLVPFAYELHLGRVKAVTADGRAVVPMYDDHKVEAVPGLWHRVGRFVFITPRPLLGIIPRRGRWVFQPNDTPEESDQ